MQQLKPEIKKITPDNPEIDNFEVHTMPAKFLTMRPSFKPGKKYKVQKSIGLKKNLIIGLIVIIVIGGLMGLAAWLFLRSVGQKPIPKPINLSAEPIQPQQPDEQPQEPQEPSTPEQDQTLLETDRWLVYENSTYYTLKYPYQWLKSGAGNQVFLKGQTGESYLEITFTDANNRSLLDWLENRGLFQENLEAFTLNNLTSYKYQDEESNTYIIYILHNNKIYSLIFTNSDEPIINKIYNLILVNFKFIEPEQPEQLEGPPIFLPSLDTDQDNLTDTEEILYGTDKNRRDTDGDSYIDGDEVANLYDPNIAGSARIYDSGVVATYVNEQYGYNIIYPASWSVKGAADSVIFQDPNGEFIQVLVTANDTGYANIKDWYQDNISSNLSDLSNIKIAQLEAIRTPDGSQAYFLFGNNIYSFIYNIGLKDNASFMTTFDMMLKSFKLMGG